MDALKQTSNVIRDHLVYIRSYPQCFAGQDLVQWFTEREEYNTKNGVSIKLVFDFRAAILSTIGVCDMPTSTE